MAKKTTKLSIKRETLRRLDAMTDEQLRQVAGGTLQNPFPGDFTVVLQTTFCAGIKTTTTSGGGGGGSLPSTPTNSCRCQPTQNC